MNRQQSNILTNKKMDLLVIGAKSEYESIGKLFDQIEDLDVNLFWEENQEAAIKLILKEEHDLYLVDCQSGELGLQLIHDILAKGYFIPFILFANAEEENIDQIALKTGAMDCLIREKLSPIELRKAVLLSLKNAAVIMELHINEKKYRNLFEQSIDAIFISNREQLFVDVNESFLKLFNHDTKERPIKTLKDLFVHDKEYQHLKNELLKKKKVKDFEALLQTCGGKKIECGISVVSLFDEEDRLSGYQGLVATSACAERPKGNC